MNIDRIVLTTFPGYFYSQIRCLRSIQQYAAGFPIDIIIDNFDIQHWPTYVEDCQHYIKFNFPEADITFRIFGNFVGMDRIRTGGWFRQQLVKLYLDQFVSGDRWLLVDADVEFTEPVRIDILSATVTKESDPISIGNRLYVKFMLGTDQPWVVNAHENWCLSSVPFRYLQRDLLEGIRDHIEKLHSKSLFDLHLELFEQDKLVAFDPSSRTMIMSEFQLIEVYRNQFYHSPMPIGECVASNFNHSSIKDWKQTRSNHEQHSIVIDEHWDCLQNFGKHHV